MTPLSSRPAGYAPIFALAAAVALAGCGQPLTPPEQPPPRAAIDQSSPRAVLLAVHHAALAGDPDALAQCFEPKFQPSLRRMLTTAYRLIAVERSFLETVRRAWGPQAADQLARSALFLPSQSAPPSPLAQVTRDGQIDWTRVAIEQAGETAAVRIEGASPLAARRIDGKWCLVHPGLGDAAQLEAALDSQAAALAVLERVLGQLARGIENGSVTRATFDEQYRKLIEQAEPAPPGPPTSSPDRAPAQPTKVRVELTSPRALLRTMQQAVLAGDRDAVVECMAPGARPAMGRLLSIDARLAAGQAALLAAMKRKFSPDMAQFFATQKLFRLAMPESLAPSVRLAWPQLFDRAVIVPKADAATVQFPDGQTWALTRINGLWRIVPPLPADADAQIRAADADANVYEKVYQDLAKGILDGSITQANYDTAKMQLLGKYSRPPRAGQ